MEMVAVCDGLILCGVFVVLYVVGFSAVVRRQGLYEDSSDEINELIFRIKEDIASLDRQLDSAQQYVDSKKRQLGEKNQSATHNVKVVSQLKTNLMQTTQQFKGVLELRSNKMKEQQHRRAALTGTSMCFGYGCNW
jgi:syntaxin 5